MRRVGEVGEQAVDAEAEELQVLGDGITAAAIEQELPLGEWPRRDDFDGQPTRPVTVRRAGGIGTYTLSENGSAFPGK